jgi:hypothetical protein
VDLGSEVTAPVAVNLAQADLPSILFRGEWVSLAGSRSGTSAMATNTLDRCVRFTPPPGRAEPLGGAGAELPADQSVMTNDVKGSALLFTK